MELINILKASYGIKPINIEQITDNVYRVEDRYGFYTFKRFSSGKQTINNWKSVFYEANEKKLLSIVPVYLAHKDQFYTIDNDELYYLSPWINGEQPSINQIYRTIGHIHARTKKTRMTNFKKIEKQFLDYNRICRKYQKKLLSFVEVFEQRRYMSPFELQVCTQYRDIEQIFNSIDKRIEQFIHKDRKSFHWNISLCHGSLSFSHVLQGQRTHIFNWEKANFQNSTMDLIKFFDYELKFYDSPSEEFINHFPTYMKENKLDVDELNFLSIYLLDPMVYLKTVQQYFDNDSTESMLNQVKKLQYIYRKLIFGLKMTQFIKTEYETIQFNDHDEDH